MARCMAGVPSVDGRTSVAALLTDEPLPISAELLPDGSDSTRPTPIVAEKLYRVSYERSHKTPPKFKDDMLQPFIKLCPNAPSNPTGWRRCVTPEGRPYFWHDALNLYTNVYLTQEGTTADLITSIESTAAYLRGQHPMRQELLSYTSDLVIALLPDDSWGYYFADNARHTVFWVHRIRISTIVGSCSRSVSTDEHLNLLMESHYWRARCLTCECCRRHVEMFPTGREAEQKTITELSGLLRCAYTDTITSTTTTSPYPTEKLGQIMKAFDSIPLDDKTGQSVWIIARFMSVFKREMFLHYWGQDSASLDRDNSVHLVMEEMPPPTCMFTMLSLFLFNMPSLYREKLAHVFVDTMLNEGNSRTQFLEVLQKDWKMAVTPSTVLLTANVSFLAISSIDNSGIAPHRSPEQIMSYASMIFSLASYLLSWILIRWYTLMVGEPSCARAATYLRTRRTSKHGLESDSIVFSLPSALFAWSMLLFSGSIIWICIVESDLATRLTISFTLSLVVIIISVALYVLGPLVASSGDGFIITMLKAANNIAYARGIAKSKNWRPGDLWLPQRTNSNLSV